MHSLSIRNIAIAGIGLFVAACSSHGMLQSPGGTGPGASFESSAGPDITTHYVYVTNNQVGGGFYSVEYFALSANGNIAPVGVISGSSTELSGSNGIVVDTHGNMFVGNETTGTITIYRPGSTGNIAPSKILAGPSTQLYAPVGLAIDTSNNIYAAQCGGFCNGTGEPDSVVVFEGGDHGNATPVQFIEGSNTQLSGANGIAVDQARNIYVTCRGTNSVLVFDAFANGNITPERVISGSNTGISNPDGIAVDAAGNTYVVQTGGSIAVFGSGANGNVAPIRVISGGNTQLSGPDGIYVSNGVLYAANRPGNIVTEYPKGANGNVSPSAIIAGSSTQLDGPSAIFER